jgi:hypothetical protein
MLVPTTDNEDTQHTRTFDTASATKNVAHEFIHPHGLTMICSLCVRRRPNWAFILWLPVSVLAGHGS